MGTGLVLAGLLVLSPAPAQTAALAPAADVVLPREPGPAPAMRAALRDLPRGVTTTLLVRDLGTGAVLAAQSPDLPLIPASTTKLVTGAVTLVSRQGARGWWSTELTVPAVQEGQPRVNALTLRGSGDPTLSVSDGANSLRALATQAYARGVRRVGEVRLDPGRVDAASFAATEYGLPMPALRLREWKSRPPGSVTEARRRLGAALIAELRRAGVQVDQDALGVAVPRRPYLSPGRPGTQTQAQAPVPAARRPESGVASVRSGPVTPFLNSTLRPSDNARAESLLAALAAAPGGQDAGSGGTLAGALNRERAALRRLGVDLGGVVLADGSGLSRDARLTSRALVDLLKVMYDLPYTASPTTDSPAQVYANRRNLFAEALPQAGVGGDKEGRGGTLAARLVGSGLDVRAKTGTLPGVSALAGYVTADSGRTLAFAVLMNGPESTPLLELRAVQDRLVRALAAVY
ncbi:D-alanyl-D-alanine carboxypeptidase [Deinococcus sp. Leaf326]|uniref:D-alanyl-D-alanine carboxypeptidase n=1 Tax=Deinococcus sp. Leaf326 TaxID=1736338 RepID=UPI000A929BBA|nr:D-alanyl-D-alanine carboxypeptidase [Deinococcus sp. Leaf326]